MGNIVYKPSIYNMLIDFSDNDYLIFNTFSGALIKIEKSLYSNFINLLNNSSKKEGELYSDIKEKFIKLGFLIENNFDEITFIKIKNRQWRHNPIIYSIAIVPNLDCNFNCKYCFENISHSYMSDATVSNIETYINRRIDNGLIKRLAVSWYGGEPLLSKKIIERLSNTFSKIEDYHAAIFTNGYSFDNNFMKNLRKYGITLVHITLDGTKEIHDQYRYLKNGRGTYNKIKDNIKKICDLHGTNVHLNIRVNLDYQNKEHCQKLIEEIKEITANNVSFIIAKILKTSSGNGAKISEELTQEDFDESCNKINHSLVENGFRKPLDFLPKRHDFHHCFVGLDNGFTINYDGSIYKCFGDVNPEQNKVGQLLSNGEISFFNETYFKWSGYDFYDDVKCRNCILLPTCMGDCARNKLGLNYDSNPECNISDNIKKTTELIKQTYIDSQTW